MLILSAQDVRELLDLDRLVDALEAAMIDVSAGHVSMPNRVAAQVADRQAMLAAMPAFLPSTPALTTKLVSLFPQNRDRPTHQALICCFDPATGTPLAVMDGTVISAMRTGAVTGVAIRHLARPDVRTAGLLGAGVLTRTQLMALASERPGLEVARVYDPNTARTEALLAELTPSLPFAVAKLQALFLQFAPGALKLTPDQVELLRTDNVVSDAAKAAGLTLEGLGITPDSIEAVAPQYLWRFRPAGQFQRKNA